MYAEIDVTQCIPPKQFQDVSGGYNRFDIFQLTVNRSANRPVTFVSRDTAADVEPKGEAASAGVSSDNKDG